VTTTLVMGAPAAATDLVGVRVRVFFGSAEDGRSPSIEGPVRAVGCCERGLRMWVEQELASRWYPTGQLFDVGGDCAIQIAPVLVDNSH
jgi:hypothetical protein